MVKPSSITAELPVRGGRRPKPARGGGVPYPGTVTEILCPRKSILTNNPISTVASLHAVDLIPLQILLTSLVLLAKFAPLRVTEVK